MVVYDLEGKEIQRSKLFDWGDIPKGDTEIRIQNYSQLFWAPRENKVLVYANKHSAIYDLGKDQVLMLGEAVPSIFGTTPVRPDGKGFLLANAENDVSFVDWEGKESAIAMPDVQKRNVRLYEILSAPAVRSWSRWEGDVAIATSGQQQWRIDTAKKTAVLQDVDEAESESDGKDNSAAPRISRWQDETRRHLLAKPAAFQKARHAGRARGPHRA